MFGTGTFALYPGHHDAVPTLVSKKQPKAPRPPPPLLITSSSKYHSALPSESLSFMEQLSSAAISDFLGPAVDGPPSPQKLRQLTRQMKRASHLQRQHGHKTTSSESSSASSLTPLDHAPLDSILDNSSFTRRSSIRSSDYGTLSRDRPESIPNFGRGFFHRRGKSNREGIAQASMDYEVSGDVTGGNNSTVGGKESILPSIFFRRKASSDESAPTKRPHISHPFNFQHVAHKHNDNAKNKSSPMLSLKGPTGISTPETGVTSSGPRRSLSQESLGGVYVGHATGNGARPPMPRYTAPSAPSPGRRQVLKQIRSQEQLGKSQSSAPPRPPRSPTQQLGDFSSFSLPRPPRTSSRQSPVSPRFPEDRSSPEAFRSQASMPPAAQTEHQYSSTDEKRFSFATPAARDSAWPLCDSALPNVPEEEEHHGPSRRSRLSVASNNSSLRGIQSVPTLRHLAESHHHCRQTSGASETLGTLDIGGIQRLVGAHARTPASLGSPTRESWEDVIDYCYEHEAEANCDYQWDRPSLDISRESIKPPDNAQTELQFEPESGSSTWYSPTRQASFFSAATQVPSLSPVSNSSSTQFESEANTPNLVSQNRFPLPHGGEENLTSTSSKEFKRLSGYSIFQESSTCHLSPSSLIPCDCQEDFLQHHADKQVYDDYEFLVEHSLHNGAELPFGKNTSYPLAAQRISTSTTASDSTSRSRSIERPYRSTNSSWSTLTRRTASCSSLSKTAGALTNDIEPLPTTQLINVAQEETKEASASHAAQDYLPDMIAFPLAKGLKKSYHKSHASESQVRNESAPVVPVESSRPLRPRAHTTHLNAQLPPPVGQYALFPRTPVKAVGDHI
ncbi:hypothetical protein E4U21_005092 [Claviceps maximensis]|nr:hypothetical protein E4U21_005092 [Claviceps maximensis]